MRETVLHLIKSYHIDSFTVLDISQYNTAVHTLLYRQIFVKDFKHGEFAQFTSRLHIHIYYYNSLLTFYGEDQVKFNTSKSCLKLRVQKYKN